MSDLKARILKATINKQANTIDKSKAFEHDETRTRVPAINIALSGRLEGGIRSGITIFAGPSKHFKTNMGLTGVSAYQKKYPEAICIFFDSERGITPAYLKSAGVDPSRVVHVPIKNVEELKFEMMQQLQILKRGDRVIFFVDSVGNLASKKEVEDAINEKSVADMTRAKALKSLFRIVTPYFPELDIPCIVINHTIQTIEMFSKEVMTGGTGVLYSSNTVIFIGKRQVKEGTKLAGYEFVLKNHKSRDVKENASIGLTVKFDGGIDPYSGLLDLAIELGFVIKPKVGWHKRTFLNEDGSWDEEEKSWRKNDTNCVEFWSPLFKHEPFREAIKREYLLGEVLSDAVIDNEVDELIGAKTTKKVEGVTLSSNGSTTTDLDDLEDLDELEDIAE